MSGDFGPIPISRLKNEASRMADALKRGQRVLISRQGQVVAQIAPASPRRHAAVLASFAVDGQGAPRAISPALLSQGAGSDAVHAAERGEVQLLTRNSKVVGVISRFVPSDDWSALMERERAMHAVETAFPDVTPEAFATVVDSYSAPTSRDSADAANRREATGSAVAAASGGVAAALLGAATGPVGVAAASLAIGAVGAVTAYRHAQYARATALRTLGEAAGAEAALRKVVETLDDESVPQDESLAIRSYLALADLYNASARPEEALNSAEHALKHIELAHAGSVA